MTTNPLYNPTLLTLKYNFSSLNKYADKVSFVTSIYLTPISFDLQIKLIFNFYMNYD